MRRRSMSARRSIGSTRRAGGILRFRGEVAERLKAAVC
jgi:hypothetical protein